jgi:hypothetical protein
MRQQLCQLLVLPDVRADAKANEEEERIFISARVPKRQLSDLSHALW